MISSWAPSWRRLCTLSLVLKTVTFVNAAVTVNSTILILAHDANATYGGTAVLEGYGIPYQVVDLSSKSASLPALNTTPSAGNFGGIITVSATDYNGQDDWKTVLSDTQWQQLYKYQEAFGIRLVRLNAWPSADFGVQAMGNSAISAELPVSVSNDSEFRTANIVVGAQVTTDGLLKYPAKITNSSLAVEIAQFGNTTKTTAAVINRFPSGREQQVWFLPFATDWSTASIFLSHAWIHWITRGVYLGYRRIYYNSQVDDVLLETELYQTGKSYRIKAADFQQHITWMKDINARLPAGSNYVMELGFNGNGNIEAAVNVDYNNDPALCDPQEGVEYKDQIDGPPDYKKPLGTGTDLWNKKFKTYEWTLECSQLDDLEVWFADKTNMLSFYHVSHTFTHEDETNATYADVMKEISWNQEWFNRIGFTSDDVAAHFSPNGLIPPGITGLHNGDAIRAWLENNITYTVGDNSRPILMEVASRKSEFHPIITNVDQNGYAGAYIVGRWGSTIYYNCDLPTCDNTEWKAIAAGSGDFTAQLEYEKTVNTKYLLGLRWDPFMFHQANLRVSDAPAIVVNGKSGKYSLLMAFTETILMEVTRLTKWPIITLKHDDLARAVIARKDRDECLPSLTYNLSDDRKTISGVTVSAANVNCGTTIPVTVAGTIKTAAGATKEQVGSDPLTLWVSLGGSAKTFAL